MQDNAKFEKKLNYCFRGMRLITWQGCFNLCFVSRFVCFYTFSSNEDVNRCCNCYWYSWLLKFVIMILFFIQMIQLISWTIKIYQKKQISNSKQDLFATGFITTLHWFFDWLIVFAWNTMLVWNTNKFKIVKQLFYFHFRLPSF